MNDYAPPAGLIKRLMALVYDGFLIMAMWFVTAGIFVVVYPHTGLPMEDINGVTRASTHYLQVILFPLLLLETWAFYAWFWMRGGQTLGMRAWRLQVRDYRGGPVKLWQTVARFAAGCVSWALFGAGYLVALVEPHQTLHDRLSATATVVLPKQSKKP
ncbi:MAG: RDD family protein [Alcanivorax sediminis]|uniref:RDD family protein n=1 Tax=Alcanivorax sediminis TaxID=2663008 RepID=A0A6N7M371_9GAMM|nr:RDD family protein [Alcanivorax sediminis]MQX54871.1 RDD family protein [Alcanivorax sediminis]